MSVSTHALLTVLCPARLCGDSLCGDSLCPARLCGGSLWLPAWPMAELWQVRGMWHECGIHENHMAVWPLAELCHALVNVALVVESSLVICILWSFVLAGQLWFPVSCLLWSVVLAGQLWFPVGNVVPDRLRLYFLGQWCLGNCGLCLVS